MGYLDFITLTYNPNGPEIQEALSQQAGQYANYQPNVVARVFRLRMKELKGDFKEGNLFSKAIAGIIAF